MGIRSKGQWWLGLIAALLVGQPLASPITVTIGTSGLTGDAQLAFDLTQGAPTPNSVTISGFETDGQLGAATLPPSGVTGGPLPADVTLTDTDFFVELLQAIALGTYITFTFDASGSATDVAPAGFAVFILDSTAQQSLVTTGDPSGALFLYSIGNSDPFQVFEPFSNGVTVTQVSRVPEPGVLSLAIAALVAFGVARTRRASLRRPSAR